MQRMSLGVREGMLIPQSSAINTHQSVINEVTNFLERKKSTKNSKGLNKNDLNWISEFHIDFQSNGKKKKNDLINIYRDNLLQKTSRLNKP